MKKITSFIILFFGLFLSSSSYAQMDAVADFFTVPSTGATTTGVLTNDTNAGVSVTASTVNVQSFDTFPSFITFNSTTGIITVSPGAPVGVYVFNYLLCETASPNNCDNAAFTISVSNLDLHVTGVYFDANANSFVDVGDVINYTYFVTNIGSISLSPVYITGLGLLSAFTVSTLGPGGGYIHNVPYVITETDINNGFVVNNASATGIDVGFVTHLDLDSTTTMLAVSDGIRLVAFADTNGNLIQDFGETEINAGTFDYITSIGMTTHSLTSTTGKITLFEGNPTNSYNLSYTVDPALAFAYSTTTTFTGITVPLASGIVDYKFPITLLPFIDLATYINPHRGPVPGTQYLNNVVLKNEGTSPISGQTLTFTCDPRLTITGYYFAGTTPTTTSPTSFTYTIPAGSPIPAGGYVTFCVILQVPVLGTPFSGYAPFALGDLLINTATVTLPSGDVRPLNNSAPLIQDVRGSYDPNDMNEAHGEKILFSSFSSSDYLTYTIRFENTGTGNAINIIVDDVLDAKLDPSTIRMIGSSASYTLDRTGNNLSWTFSGINLPPSISSTSLVGKGYITFQVKPTAGYSIGDIIPNTANIYFDFNPAIVTNTFLTEFVSTLAVNGFENKNVKIFPNPANNILNIESLETILQIELFDNNGRKILSVNSLDKSSIIDLSQYSAGLYIVKTTTNSGSSIEKIVKK